MFKEEKEKSCISQSLHQGELCRKCKLSLFTFHKGLEVRLCARVREQCFFKPGDRLYVWAHQTD